ncbi:MAG: XRE family transcriptional regulator [Cytophagales bacterium]|nr:MAG: XRE family transcriptional regulator [Cytophagales bacterium]
MNTEPTFTTETVHKNITKARKEKGLTYDNMAHELSISTPAYRKIELGQTHLTVDRLYQIASILQIKVALLLGIQPENTPNAGQLEASLREIITAKDNAIDALRETNAMLKTRVNTQGIQIA